MASRAFANARSRTRRAGLLGEARRAALSNRKGAADLLRMLLAGDAMDGAHRTPGLAARALPVVRLRAEAALVATVHGLAFEQLAREILQDQQME